MSYLVAFAIAFALSLAITPLVRRFAIARGILDLPAERKVHVEPVARMGGLAIVASFMAVTLAVVPATRQLSALLGGVVILAVVGIIDDVRGLAPGVKFAWQIVAAMVALAGGIGITAITNPLGGSIDLQWGRFPVDVWGWHFHIAPIANLISILWMVGMVNVINFLDGLDGLACGVSTITALVMFVLALNVDQPIVALLAIITAGSALGFLPYNFFPARIFMGDTGAYFLGLIIAMLAIYSGGKLATALLVVGFTIIDSLWAVIRRLRRGSHPFKADREHLHHLLLEAGLSQRVAVLLLYLLAVIFGLIALASGSFSKLVALIVLIVVTVTLIATLLRLAGRRRV
ncbi:MAG TPA: MraY family glycosyltransferase [Candidatus Saccharimonadales bacterium]|nr:MraY family glycosyltransferase [Candidatus Saccharimonadales bacterium]